MTEWISRNASLLGISLVVVALTLWVLTGNRETIEQAGPELAKAVRVELTTSRAKLIERVLTVQGHAEPEQVVRVRAKTDGQVAETPVEEGALVKSGQLVARLEMDDRQARLREARAALRQVEGDYRAAQRLADQGLQAELEAERARAELEAARARVAAIELDIEHTRITTPIDGILNEQIARRGDYVKSGEPVAEIVQNDPLRAVVQIPQHRVGEVAEGQKARVTFLDGEEREGELNYVSATADPRTRTFTARVNVANPERDLPAGISVTVKIPVESVRAHAISPALISRSEDGRLGVKVAEDRDGEMFARFVPIEPVRADANRIWVTGLADETRLITRGQGFVRDGDRIEANGNDGP